MDLKTFELLARYNIWSTTKLNQVLKTVSNDDFNAECGQRWIRKFEQHL